MVHPLFVLHTLARAELTSVMGYSLIRKAFIFVYCKKMHSTSCIEVSLARTAVFVIMWMEVPAALIKMDLFMKLCVQTVAEVFLFLLLPALMQRQELAAQIAAWRW